MLRIRGKPYNPRRVLRNTEGAAAVEFAIILNLFLIMLLGMIEFGHALYMKQMIINASREGARYGVVYRSDASGNRIAPAALTPSIQNWILQDSSSGGEIGLTGLLGTDATPTVTLSGAGYTSGQVGAPLVVTVTAMKNWWFINNFLPFLGSQIQLTAETVMRVE